MSFTLVLLFTATIISGQPPVTISTKEIKTTFRTEKACNTAGEKIRKDLSGENGQTAIVTNVKFSCINTGLQ